ncbi:hypothetical protein EON67_01205 [archaeon]|nr:MAG: hypothetical protein EON67_01205 [archaeon]
MSSPASTCPLPSYTASCVRQAPRLRAAYERVTLLAATWRIVLPCFKVSSVRVAFTLPRPALRARRFVCLLPGCAYACVRPCLLRIMFRAGVLARCLLVVGLLASASAAALMAIDLGHEFMKVCATCSLRWTPCTHVSVLRAHPTRVCAGARPGEGWTRRGVAARGTGRGVSPDASAHAADCCAPKARARCMQHRRAQPLCTWRA